MSGARTTPARFDVVATTRRIWSPEQKRAIVAEIDVTGGSVSVVARRHGIHSSQLFRWRRELGGAPASTDEVSPVTFVPVVVEPCHQRVPRQGLRSLGTANNFSIEILIGQGRVVRVGSDVDTAALVRIIEALEARQ